MIYEFNSYALNYYQVIVEKGQRVPADLVLLRTTEKSGACFVRTDQLDGETDWKLRLAVPATQKLESNSQLFDIKASLYVEKPQKDIHSFIGTFSRVNFNFFIFDLRSSRFFYVIIFISSMMDTAVKKVWVWIIHYGPTQQWHLVPPLVLSFIPVRKRDL